MLNLKIEVVVEDSLFHLYMYQNVVSTWDQVGLDKREHDM
jgi:hypothetical protein